MKHEKNTIEWWFARVADKELRHKLFKELEEPSFTCLTFGRALGEAFDFGKVKHFDKDEIEDISTRALMDQIELLEEPVFDYPEKHGESQELVNEDDGKKIIIEQNKDGNISCVNTGFGDIEAYGIFKLYCEQLKELILNEKSA